MNMTLPQFALFSRSAIRTQHRSYLDEMNYNRIAFHCLKEEEYKKFVRLTENQLRRL